MDWGYSCRLSLWPQCTIIKILTYVDLENDGCWQNSNSDLIFSQGLLLATPVPSVWGQWDFNLWGSAEVARQFRSGGSQCPWDPTWWSEAFTWWPSSSKDHKLTSTQRKVRLLKLYCIIFSTLTYSCWCQRLILKLSVLDLTINQCSVDLLQNGVTLTIFQTLA